MYKLSDKEKKIVLFIAKGLKNKEIAVELNLAHNSINTYIYKLFQIYGAKNRIDLVNKIRGGIKHE